MRRLPPSLTAPFADAPETEDPGSDREAGEVSADPAARLGRRGVIGRLGLLFGAALIARPRVTEAAWDIVQIEGRDYISTQSIHAFYRFTSHDQSGKKVVLRSPALSMTVTAGSQEMIINRVKFVLSFPVRESGGKVVVSRVDLVKLIDPVLRPSYIRVAEPFNTVVVDPGHGGQDPGARSVYGDEKTFALDTARRLRAELQRRGFAVKMTRDDDSYPSLSDRVRFANSVANAIFISVHYNYYRRTEAAGIETFALSPQGTSATYKDSRSSDALNFTGNRRDSENIALATAVHAAALYRTGAFDRGVKRDRFAVLKGINKPSALLEGGFLSNRTEARKVATASYRQLLAEAVGQAVANYRRALQKS